MSAGADLLPVRAAIQQARRASVAGSALWRAGLAPEGHAQMDQALRTALQVWTPAREEPPSDEAPPEQQALIALDRAGYRRLDRLRAALATPVSLAVPDGGPDAGLGVGLSPERAFDLTCTEAQRLIAFTARRQATRTERRRRRLRIQSALAAGLVAAVVVGALLWHRPRASASGVYDVGYPAANAIDGHDTTEWLLPDGAKGWVQIVFPSARRVRRVVLVNSHNRNYLDRAAKQVRVTAYSDFESLASATGSFTAVVSERSTIDLPLEARNVTHIRVEILSHFGAGGGLAEVEVH